MRLRFLNLLTRNLINFIIVIIPFIFWQDSLDPFGPAQLAAGRIFLPLLFLLFLAGAFLKGKGAMKKSPLLLPLAGYIAASGISVFFSINTGISLKYFSELTLFIFGAWLVDSLLDKDGLKRVLFMVVVIHTIMAFYGILQHFGADPFSWNTAFAGRPMGTIGNPDFFAGQMLIPLFILMSYIFFGGKYKKYAVAALVINILCFYFTKVIGAYIGFMAGFMVFIAGAVYFRREEARVFSSKYLKKTAAAALIIIIFAAGAVFFTPVKGKIADYYKYKKRSLVHRLLMWESSLLMFRDAPFTGKGIGSYRLNYPLYQAELINNPKNKEYEYVVTWMPHQNYLLVLAETGVLGFGFFLLALVIFYFLGYDALVRKKKANFINFGAVCGITGILGASFFNTFYNIPSTTFYFFLFLFIPGFYAGGGKVFVIRKKAAAALFIPAAAVLFVFVSGDAESITSNIYLKKANKLSERKKYRPALEYYKRITDISPTELTPQMDVGYYYFAAETFRKAGKLKKAYEYYKKDLEINPYCPEVNNMLGAVAGQLGKFDEAVKRLELAVYIAPHYEAAFTNLATAYVAAGEFDSAEKALLKYMEMNGKEEKFMRLLKAVRKKKN